MATMLCDVMASDFATRVQQLQKASKIPNSLLAAAERYANMAQLDLSFISGLVSAFDIPDVGEIASMSALRSALVTLTNCAFFSGDSGALGAFNDAIDAIDGGATTAAQLPSSFLNWQANKTVSDLQGMLDDALANSPLGKIDKLYATYAAVVREARIPELLDTLDTMVSCMNGVCDGVTEFQGVVDDYRDALNIDGSGVPELPLSASSAVSQAKLDAIASAKSSLDTLRTNIAAASLI